MVRRGLLGGAAVAAMAPALALAQAPSPRTDGLPPEAVYIEAEDVARDADTGLITAHGGEDRVLARFEGRNLRAREITYNLNSGVATAVGDAELIDVDGTVITAQRLELDEDMRAGVAVDLAVRASDGSSLMAATAVRAGP